MENNKNIDNKLWNAVAYISGIFSFVICVLIIANYLQIARLDPVNTNVINVLIERLNENPEDAELRNEIRELDLLARKAYFTNNWQIKTGGYMLLISIIILLIALQIIDSGKNNIQLNTNIENEKYYLTQKKARKWITIGGITFALITLFFAFLSHKKINNKFSTTVKKVIKSEAETIIEPVYLTQDSLIEEEVIDTLVIKEYIDTIKTESITEVKEKETVSMAYPTSAMKRNFPAFRGPGGNGIAYQTNIPENWDGESGKNILWKIPIPTHGYNSPVIWGDYIFLSGADANKQQVYCFNRLNGKTIWVVEASKIKGTPEKKPDVTDDTGHAAASVTSDGKAVYAIFSSGDIIALSMSGTELWSKNLGSTGNHYGHSSSLYIVNNKLIVQYDIKKSPKIMALSTKTGDIVWSADRNVKISWASPIVVNTGSRIEVIVLSNPNATSYDSETGEKLWEIECTYGEVGPSLAYSSGRVFALNEYAKLVAIDISNGQAKILWEDDEFLSDVPSPVATKDLLFVATSYGEIVCYNAKTGEQNWIEDFGSGIYSSPILVDNKIYLIDKNGVMHIFKADKTFQLVGRPKLGEKTDCTPAFANGRIYIRAGNNLYCIGEE